MRPITHFSQKPFCVIDFAGFSSPRTLKLSMSVCWASMPETGAVSLLSTLAHPKPSFTMLYTTHDFNGGICWWDCIHSGHVSWTLAGHLRYFHRFSDAFLINIQLFQHSLVYFDFSTYEQYHMLIAQPLWPITNHITACFTFIPSFLPSAYDITGDWGIFVYITWP